MASSFLQDLGASLQIFKQGVQDVGMQRAIAAANDQVQQIRDSSLAEDDKQQAMRNLSQDITLKFMQSGAPASQIEQFTSAFRPKEPNLQTPEEAVMLGNTKQRAAGQGLLEQKQKFALEQIKAKTDASLEGIAMKSAGAQKKILDKTALDLKADLDPNKARGGELAKSQGVLNRINRLDALFQQFPDGNIPKAQMVELATGLAAIYSGGQPQSQHQIDAIVPSSMKGDSRAVAGWFLNEPTGLEQQKFVQVLQESSNREKATVSDAIKQAQLQRLPAYSSFKQADPQRYQGILRGYGLVDEPSQAANSLQSGSQLSPNTNQAPSSSVGPSKYFR